MIPVWQSKNLYEHPAPHNAGRHGYVCMSGAGVYVLKVGGSVMSCPQDWASKIHAQEIGRQNPIREAIAWIDKAIALMEASKDAFKSSQIAEARKYTQEAKNILIQI